SSNASEANVRTVSLPSGPRDVIAFGGQLVPGQSYGAVLLYVDASGALVAATGPTGVNEVAHVDFLPRNGVLWPDVLAISEGSTNDVSRFVPSPALAPSVLAPTAGLAAGSPVFDFATFDIDGDGQRDVAVRGPGHALI